MTALDTSELRERHSQRSCRSRRQQSSVRRDGHALIFIVVHYQRPKLFLGGVVSSSRTAGSRVSAAGGSGRTESAEVVQLCYDLIQFLGTTIPLSRLRMVHTICQHGDTERSSTTDIHTDVWSSGRT